MNVIDLATPVLDALLPAGELSDLSPRQLGSASRGAVREVVEAWPAEVRALFAAIVLVTWVLGPAVWLRRACSFGALPAADREVMLGRLARSRVYLARAAFTLLKVAAGLRLGVLGLAAPEPITLASRLQPVPRGRRRLPVVVAVSALEVRHA